MAHRQSKVTMIESNVYYTSDCEVLFTKTTSLDTRPGNLNESGEVGSG